MPYIDTSVIEKVKQIDLLTYLQEREPDELVRIGPSAYCTKEHDSLKITNGKWFWWSRGFGGRSALDYLIKVRGMGFVDAVLHLNGSGITSVPRLQTEPRRNRPKRTILQLPPISKSEIAILYLRKRGIEPAIIQHCLDEGSIYGSLNKRHENVVFVGRDSSGVSRYASLRGCKGDFKGEAAGSDKRYSFRLAMNPYNPDYMEGEVWQKVVPHFQGINDYMVEVGCPYSIGIYSARNACGIVSAEGLAPSRFASDMSTGYSANLGYPLPNNWAFDQIQEYPLNASDGSFGIDKNTVSGSYRGFAQTGAGSWYYHKRRR